MITISAIDLNHKSNYQDFGRYVEADLSITGDAEATLPALIEAVKKLITPDRKRAFEARGAKIAEANQQARASANRESCRRGLGRQPHQHRALWPPELWTQIKNEDWSLVSNDRYPSYWSTTPVGISKSTITTSAHRAARNRLRSSGGRGRGAGQPQARTPDRRIFNSDGDLNYAPGVLWTAAHHRIPLLTIDAQQSRLSSGAHVH